MADPRVFQGSPLTEVPLEWLRARSEGDRFRRNLAAEVAPGVFVQVAAWGDFIMPGGKVGSGARIAVWAEPAVDMGYLSLPAGVQADIEEQVAQKPGGSLNPTPDCGGPRKPPGAAKRWWCQACREFHAPAGEESGQ